MGSEITFEIPSMPSYEAGFLYGTIMVIGNEISHQKDYESEIDFEGMILRYEEDHIWLEGIDWLIPLPDNIAKELFFLKHDL